MWQHEVDENSVSVTCCSSLMRLGLQYSGGVRWQVVDGEACISSLRQREKERERKREIESGRERELGIRTREAMEVRERS